MTDIPREIPARNSRRSLQMNRGFAILLTCLILGSGVVWIGSGHFGFNPDVKALPGQVSETEDLKAADERNEELQQQNDLAGSTNPALQDLTFQENNIAALEEQVDEVRNLLNERETQLNERETQAQELQKQLAGKDSMIAQLLAEKEDLESQIANIQPKLIQTSQEMDELDLQIIQLNNKVVQLEDELLQNNGEKEELEARISKTVSPIQDHVQQGLDLQLQVDQLQGQLDAADLALSQIKQERVAKEILLIDLRDKLDAVEEENQDRIDELDLEIITLVSERDSLSFKLEELQENFDDLQTNWNAWEEHSQVAPQRRAGYDYIGFTPTPGQYSVAQTSFFVSFPDATNCLLESSLLATSSMKPAFDAGHTVVLTTCFTETELQPGDMIAYQPESGAPILHQIMEISSNGLKTKGISNNVEDSALVETTDILGIVVAIIY